MKKKITVGFTDFWNGFKKDDNLFYEILSSKYDVEISDRPNYLFCSCFSSEHLKYDCIKIFYTGENQFPDMNLYDYAIGFDYMALGDRYFRFPFFYMDKESCERMEHRHEVNPSELLADKKRFCSFVYSNDKASIQRVQFMNRLSSYKQVSSGGRYLNNIGGAVTDKNEFLKGCKFDICFENTCHPGYTTEKLVQAFGAGTVPIYRGDPLVGNVFNKEAFIDCNDFKDIDSVVEKVRQIDEDDKLYCDMLAKPALLSESDSREEKVRQLSEFLFNIFDQPVDKAWRRSREFWSSRYSSILIRNENAYRHSLNGLISMGYRHTLWKWKKKSKTVWKIDRLLHKA